jgi:hypothetical protein
MVTFWLPIDWLELRWSYQNHTTGLGFLFHATHLCWFLENAYSTSTVAQPIKILRKVVRQMTASLGKRSNFEIKAKVSAVVITSFTAE